MVKASDLRSRVRQFDFFRPFYFHVITLGKLFTHILASVTKQYNLVPAKAGTCTMHWPHDGALVALAG